VRLRAEELVNDPKLKGPYDLIVSRATAPLVDLMKWSQPVLKSTGKILTLKGGDLQEEIRQAQTKFKDADITVIDLHVRGVEWFEEEEKRLVRVRWNGGEEKAEQESGEKSEEDTVTTLS
jgi:16S rRNA (guanine527-N7)-methyltransferase